MRLLVPVLISIGLIFSSYGYQQDTKYSVDGKDTVDYFGDGRFVIISHYDENIDKDKDY